MKHHLPFMVAIGSTLVFLTVACPNPPNSPPDADAARQVVDVSMMGDPNTDDICSLACANLRAKNCSEGTPPCEDICHHAQDSGVFDMKPACLAPARSVDELRACGTVKCGK